MITRTATVGLTALMLLTLTGALGWAQEPLIGEVKVEGNNYVAREPILEAVKDILKIGEPFHPAAGGAGARSDHAHGLL